MVIDFEDPMKKSIYLIIMIIFVVLCFSGCFFEETLSYVQGTDDIINTVYVLGIVGFVAGWLYTHK
jgi:hypothetical protein